MKKFYALACIIGTLLPFWPLSIWIQENGFNPQAFYEGTHSTLLGHFAWLDLLVSAGVFFAFVWLEGQRLKMKHLWLPVLAVILVGVSLGLPLFLYMREDALTKNT